MNRFLTFALGPEIIVVGTAIFVYWFCGRHHSGAGRDLIVLERLVTLLPLFVVPAIFSTIFVPGARNWLWLGRALGFTFLGLVLCSAKIIGAFGTGAKGQDAAFILVIVFAIILSSIGSAISGAMILSAVKPAVGVWFRQHPVAGGVLTVLSAVPIGFVLGLTVTLLIGLVAGVWSAFR